MNDNIFDKLLQARQDVRKAQEAQEFRRLILWMAALCGLGVIAIKIMGM